MGGVAEIRRTNAHTHDAGASARGARNLVEHVQSTNLLRHDEPHRQQIKDFGCLVWRWSYERTCMENGE
jgi:hypothetical protein